MTLEEAIAEIRLANSCRYNAESVSDEVLAIVFDAAEKWAKHLDAVKLKGTLRCENCKHIQESETTNRLWCSYHSEGEYEYETYKNHYCSDYESVAYRAAQEGK